MDATDRPTDERRRATRPWRGLRVLEAQTGPTDAPAPAQGRTEDARPPDDALLPAYRRLRRMGQRVELGGAEPPGQ